ncbi:MAG: phasin family protein [Roseiflexus sp.]|nr:phasin family protein [Roseiflexus sp.]MCS7291062.1 phasin family protein [Roseiflexus sp.]MDW8145809.1 phasin family protein [Roseiflexaceae bacterium]MDW8232947.1 phasin family protein [Roseiflexaceae bacterium]
MTEEVEVKVTEVEESAPSANRWIIDGMRRLLLASFGAVAMTFDEVEAFVKKLVERGELAQKDAEKLLHEMQQRLTARSQVERVTDRVEQGMEEFLNRLNIPSKRDIDELSQKIAQLAARVEELRKSQE